MKIPCGNCEKYDRREECLRDPPNPPTYQQFLIKQERKRKYLEKRYNLVSSKQGDLSEGRIDTYSNPGQSPPLQNYVIGSSPALTKVNSQNELPHKSHDSILRQHSSMLSPNTSLHKPDTLKYIEPFPTTYGEHNYQMNPYAFTDYKTYNLGANTKILPAPSLQPNTPQMPITTHQHQQQLSQQHLNYYPELPTPYGQPVQMMNSPAPAAPQTSQTFIRATESNPAQQAQFQPGVGIPLFRESPYLPVVQPILQPQVPEPLPPIPQYPHLPPQVRLPAISEQQRIAPASSIPGLPPPPLLASKSSYEHYGLRLPLQLPYPIPNPVGGKEQTSAQGLGPVQAPLWSNHPSNYMMNTETLVPRAYEPPDGRESSFLRPPNMENIHEEYASNYTRPITHFIHPSMARNTETNSNSSSFDDSPKLTSLSSMSSSVDKQTFVPEPKQSKNTEH